LTAGARALALELLQLDQLGDDRVLAQELDAVFAAGILRPFRS
jgi:hypothetical protein